MAVESEPGPQGAHPAKPGALGSRRCIPSLGGVFLPLRHVFSIFFFFSFLFSFRLVELALSPVAKAKPDSGVAALSQQPSLSSSLLEPPRQAAGQSHGSF